MAEEQKPVAVPAEETPATTTTETTAAAATDAPVEAAKEETAPAGMRNNSPILSNMTNIDTAC